METAAVILIVTFGLGYVASLLRLPPLVGFLGAGFALNALGYVQVPLIDSIAGVGVTLMLFGIGLKLDIRSLLHREVWLTATVHMAATVAASMGLLLVISLVGFSLLTDIDAASLAMLGLALAFSSTVFVVKLLEERGQGHAFYGRLSIGILIIQDIVAVIFLTASSGHLPSLWALSVVLLWPLTRLFRRLWGRLGHGEMQSLFGILMALVPGYLFFELVGLKGDLGALVMGVLLASHPSSSELSRALFHFKELLLVGFFVSIGLAGGLPTLQHIGLAALLLLLLPIKAVVLMLLLRLSRLRNRTGWLVALALMQFSEFGLIVVDVGADSGLIDSQWLIVLSVSVSFSFVVSAMLNSRGQLIEQIAKRGPVQDPTRLHHEDQPADVTGAEALVLGMGRVGRSTYERLEDGYQLAVTGVDSDGGRVTKLGAQGVKIVEADASDPEFWDRLIGKEQVRMVIVAMPRHGANLSAVKSLREHGYTGTIAAVARYEDEVAHAKEDGADAAFNVYTGAGLELADQVMRIEAGEPPTRPLRIGW